MNEFDCTDAVRASRHCMRHLFGAFARRAYDHLEPGRPLVPCWHFDHIAYVLGEAEAGRKRSIIINIQPRSLKSFLVSVAFPAWLLGRDPSRRIACVSYGDKLSRHFGTQSRALMMSRWYQDTFPEARLASSRPRADDLRTEANGYRYAVSLNGAITGRGADFLICDDPMKAQDVLSAVARQKVVETSASGLWNRLNDHTRDVKILVMQRLHEDDLAGHLIRQGGWEVVSLPAAAVENGIYRLGPLPHHVHVRKIGDLLQPARESLADLAEQRRVLGTYNFEAQYQQQPVPAAGIVVRREWLGYYDDPPETWDRLVISWDTASTLDDKSDFSVGTVWARVGDKMYLLEVLRERFEVPQLQRAIIELSRRYEADKIFVENDGIGRGIVQNIRQRRLTSPLPKLVNPDADKTVRFARHLSLIEDGRMYLPKEAGWLGEYLQELLAFPYGTYDDQVDSTTQALDHLTWNEAIARPLERRDVEPRSLQRRDLPRPTIRRR